MNDSAPSQQSQHQPAPHPDNCEVPLPRLTKRDYFAVHLFQGVTAQLSANCTLRDKANYAVEAADALIRALEIPPKEGR